jgi:hypothetical protein
VLEELDGTADNIPTSVGSIESVVRPLAAVPKSPVAAETLVVL